MADGAGLPDPPGPDAPAGWRPVGANPNLQVHWDGDAWTAARRWQGAAWEEVALADIAAATESGGEPRPTAAGARHRGWRSERRGVIGLVVAIGVIGAVGGLVAVVVATVGDTPPPLPIAIGSVPSSTAGHAAASAVHGGSGSAGSGGTTGSAAATACKADVESVQAVLDGYQAANGAYPSPAQPWSAAAYAANYAPLSGGGSPGLALRGAPGTSHYVIEFDAAGHVWVEPAGHFGAYDPARDIALNPTACDVAGP